VICSDLATGGWLRSQCLLWVKSSRFILSDSHGKPPLIADHELPATAPFAGAPGALDALDWYGLWRPFDALVACSRTGQECATALGDTPEQKFMGRWSDGVPVIELKVTDSPKTP
jgi:hypothetical protein